MVSEESYCHLQMFSRWPNMFWELFSDLLARRSCYFNLEELIVFDISSVRAFKDV